MTLLLLYVGLALTVSFMCSILEAVLLSVTPGHVAVLESENHPVAHRLRRFKDDIDRPLAAILSLNTIAHTVGAAGAGAQAARVFGDAAVGIFSAILTFVILVATEIVPKTLGAVHWKRLTPIVVRALTVLIPLVWPLVKLAQWLTDLLTPDRPDTKVSRTELAVLAEEGEKTGVIEEGESRMFRNLLRLGVLRVRDVMTPAQHVLALPADALVHDVIGNDEPQFSRIPLFREEHGRRAYTGYVLKDDLLVHAARTDDPVALHDMARELLTVRDDMPLPEVFDRMVDRREHIAVALDEQEGMSGVITMEDIIETLLGLEIFDEVDDSDRLQEAARAHWQQRAERLGRISDATGAEAKLGITGAAAAREGIRRGGATPRRAEPPPPARSSRPARPSA